MMDNPEGIRLECIKLALQTLDGNPLALAERFYKFVSTGDDPSAGAPELARHPVGFPGGIRWIDEEITK